MYVQLHPKFDYPIRINYNGKSLVISRGHVYQIPDLVYNDNKTSLIAVGHEKVEPPKPLEIKTEEVKIPISNTKPLQSKKIDKKKLAKTVDLDKAVPEIKKSINALNKREEEKDATNLNERSEGENSI